MRRELVGGGPVATAAEATLVRMAKSCTLTSLTTAIGFASLITAQVPKVGESGLICAASVMLTWVAATLRWIVMMAMFVPLMNATKMIKNATMLLCPSQVQKNLRYPKCVQIN